MNAIGQNDLQMLLDRSRGAGMVVSCYADTSVVEGFQPHWRQPMKDEARRAREALTDDHAALVEFERQLELIRSQLESAPGRAARGTAVFAASGWDKALALDNEVPFENRLVVDEEPYLVPFLVDQVLRPQYLAVVTDTHHGHIYAARPGSARQLARVEGDVPRKNRSAGERWGKQQATIARHREDCILHYFKDLAARVVDAWDETQYRGIVLLGEHEVLEDFRTHLPKRLDGHVLAEGPHSWLGEARAVEDQVGEVVAVIVGAEQERLLDEIDGRLREGCAVTTGPREVIEALNNGLARTLVLGPDPGEVARRCRGCHSLFTAAETTCPYCQSPCDRTNLWQEILIRAVRHGVDVHFVPTKSVRTVPNGIAALLARDEPRWAAAPSVEAAAAAGPARP
jgi:hypothetical protein